MPRRRRRSLSLRATLILRSLAPASVNRRLRIAIARSGRRPMARYSYRYLSRLNFTRNSQLTTRLSFPASCHRSSTDILSPTGFNRRPSMDRRAYGVLCARSADWRASRPELRWPPVIAVEVSRANTNLIHTFQSSSIDASASAMRGSNHFSVNSPFT